MGEVEVGPLKIKLPGVREHLKQLRRKWETKDRQDLVRDIVDPAPTARKIAVRVPKAWPDNIRNYLHDKNSFFRNALINRPDVLQEMIEKYSKNPDFSEEVEFMKRALAQRAEQVRYIERWKSNTESYEFWIRTEHEGNAVLDRWWSTERAWARALPEVTEQQRIHMTAEWLQNQYPGLWVAPHFEDTLAPGEALAYKRDVINRIRSSSWVLWRATDASRAQRELQTRHSPPEYYPQGSGILFGFNANEIYLPGDGILNGWEAVEKDWKGLAKRKAQVLGHPVDMEDATWIYEAWLPKNRTVISLNDLKALYAAHASDLAESTRGRVTREEYMFGMDLGEFAYSLRLDAVYWYESNGTFTGKASPRMLVVNPEAIVYDSDMYPRFHPEEVQSHPTSASVGGKEQLAKMQAMGKELMEADPIENGAVISSLEMEEIRKRSLDKVYDNLQRLIMPDLRYRTMVKFVQQGMNGIFAQQTRQFTALLENRPHIANWREHGFTEEQSIARMQAKVDMAKDIDRMVPVLTNYRVGDGRQVWRAPDEWDGNAELDIVDDLALVYPLEEKWWNVMDQLRESGLRGMIEFLDDRGVQVMGMREGSISPQPAKRYRPDLKQIRIHPRDTQDAIRAQVFHAFFREALAPTKTGEGLVVPRGAFDTTVPRLLHIGVPDEALVGTDIAAAYRGAVYEFWASSVNGQTDVEPWQTIKRNWAGDGASMDPYGDPTVLPFIPEMPIREYGRLLLYPGESGVHNGQAVETVLLDFSNAMGFLFNENLRYLRRINVHGGELGNTFHEVFDNMDQMPRFEGGELHTTWITLLHEIRKYAQYRDDMRHKYPAMMKLFESIQEKMSGDRHAMLTPYVSRMIKSSGNLERSVDEIRASASPYGMGMSNARNYMRMMVKFILSPEHGAGIEDEALKHMLRRVHHIAREHHYPGFMVWSAAKWHEKFGRTDYQTEPDVFELLKEWEDRTRATDITGRREISVDIEDGSGPPLRQVILPAPEDHFEMLRAIPGFADSDVESMALDLQVQHERMGFPESMPEWRNAMLRPRFDRYVGSEFAVYVSPEEHEMIRQGARVHQEQMEARDYENVYKNEAHPRYLSTDTGEYNKPRIPVTKARFDELPGLPLWRSTRFENWEDEIEGFFSGINEEMSGLYYSMKIKGPINEQGRRPVGHRDYVYTTLDFTGGMLSRDTAWMYRAKMPMDSVLVTRMDVFKLWVEYADRIGIPNSATERFLSEIMGYGDFGLDLTEFAAIAGIDGVFYMRQAGRTEGATLTLTRGFKLVVDPSTDPRNHPPMTDGYGDLEWNNIYGEQYRNDFMREAWAAEGFDAETLFAMRRRGLEVARENLDAIVEAIAEGGADTKILANFEAVERAQRMKRLLERDNVPMVFDTPRRRPDASEMQGLSFEELAAMDIGARADARHVIHVHVPHGNTREQVPMPLSFLISRADLREQDGVWVTRRGHPVQLDEDGNPMFDDEHEPILAVPEHIAALRHVESGRYFTDQGHMVRLNDDGEPLFVYPPESGDPQPVLMKLEDFPQHEDHPHLRRMPNGELLDPSGQLAEMSFMTGMPDGSLPPPMTDADGNPKMAGMFAHLDAEKRPLYHPNGDLILARPHQPPMSEFHARIEEHGLVQLPDGKWMAPDGSTVLARVDGQPMFFADGRPIMDGGKVRMDPDGYPILVEAVAVMERERTVISHLVLGEGHWLTVHGVEIWRVGNRWMTSAGMIVKSEAVARADGTYDVVPSFSQGHTLTLVDEAIVLSGTGAPLFSLEGRPIVTSPHHMSDYDPDNPISFTVMPKGEGAQPVTLTQNEYGGYVTDEGMSVQITDYGQPQFDPHDNPLPQVQYGPSDLIQLPNGNWVTPEGYLVVLDDHGHPITGITGIVKLQTGQLPVEIPAHLLPPDIPALIAENNLIRLNNGNWVTPEGQIARFDEDWNPVFDNGVTVISNLVVAKDDAGNFLYEADGIIPQIENVGVPEEILREMIFGMSSDLPVPANLNLPDPNIATLIQANGLTQLPNGSWVTFGGDIVKLDADGNPKFNSEGLPIPTMLTVAKDIDDGRFLFHPESGVPLLNVNSLPQPAINKLVPGMGDIPARSPTGEPLVNAAGDTVTLSQSAGLTGVTPDDLTQGADGTWSYHGRVIEVGEFQNPLISGSGDIYFTGENVAVTTPSVPVEEEIAPTPITDEIDAVHEYNLLPVGPSPGAVGDSISTGWIDWYGYEVATDANNMPLIWNGAPVKTGKKFQMSVPGNPQYDSDHNLIPVTGATAQTDVPEPHPPDPPGPDASLEEKIVYNELSQLNNGNWITPDGDLIQLDADGNPKFEHSGIAIATNFSVQMDDAGQVVYQAGNVMPEMADIHVPPNVVANLLLNPVSDLVELPDGHWMTAEGHIVETDIFNNPLFTGGQPDLSGEAVQLGDDGQPLFDVNGNPVLVE